MVCRHFFLPSSYNELGKYFSVPASNALARHASERRDGGYLRLLVDVAIKIKIPRTQGFRDSLKNPFVRAGLIAFLTVCAVVWGVWAFYYIKYQKVVDARMHGQIFAN